jgi:hypothetical protein
LLLSRFAAALRRPATEEARPARRFAVPSWPLGVIAVGLALYVWVDPIVELPLHPEQGAVIPSLGVRAGDSQPERLADLDPQECSLGSSSSLYVDEMLVPLAANYGAYLLGLDDGACFALSAMVSIPALAPEEMQRIESIRANQAPVRLRLTSEPPGYLTVVETGVLADSGDLPAGLTPGQRYAVVVRVDRTEAQDRVREVVDLLAKLAFEAPPS